MRSLVVAWILCGSAFASEGEWAGVPLDTLPTVGIGAPTFSHLTEGWRAPLPSGGFIQMTIYADAELAAAGIAASRQSAMTRRAPANDNAGGDEAFGDGQGLLLIRDGNVVILVRDLGNNALAHATTLRGLLVNQAPPGEWDTSFIGGQSSVRRDRCGRPLD